MILGVLLLGEWWFWLGWGAPLEVGCERGTPQHVLAWAAVVSCTAVVLDFTQLPYDTGPLVKVHYC